MNNIMRITFVFVLVSIFVFASPAAVQATPASTSMTVSWGMWPFNKTVTISSDTYANPTLTATWAGGQPVLGMVVGGGWNMKSENGTSFTVSSDKFKISSDNPNLPFKYVADGMTPETGVIGEGKYFTFFLDPRIPVVITIGK